jgi:riboflavin biosynthesis pyrimidine reductase
MVQSLVMSSLRPEVTLIIASSADGCLVSQDSDELDFNKNWKNSNLVRGIIYQFFDFIKNTEVYNVTTAEALVKLGVNDSHFVPKKNDLRLIVLDTTNKLTTLGVQNLAESVKKLIVVAHKQGTHLTTASLPENCRTYFYDKVLNLKKLMTSLKKDYTISKVTIQSAGKMNAQWLSAGVVDYLTLIVYPLLVGNNGTPVLFSETLFTIKPLHLFSSGVFDSNYISLQYRVINEERTRN